MSEDTVNSTAEVYSVPRVVSVDNTGCPTGGAWCDFCGLHGQCPFWSDSPRKEEQDARRGPYTAAIFV